MSDQALITTSRSARDTEQLAARIAQTLTPGDVVLISGDLGAGKTTFVRGACRALGVSSPVTSPTFTIGHIYEVDSAGSGTAPPAARETAAAPTVKTVSHLDLYRLQSLAGEDPDLIADYVGADTVAFVEWPAGGEHELQELGRIAYRVALEHAGADTRTVTVTDLRGQAQAR